MSDNKSPCTPVTMKPWAVETKLVHEIPKIAVEEEPRKAELPVNRKTSLDLASVLVLGQTPTGYNGKLTVQNTSNKNICYRVRASEPFRYNITPAIGCIGIAKKIDISFCTVANSKNINFDQMKDDVFDLDAAPMPIISTCLYSLSSFWKKHSDEKFVERYRIDYLILFKDLDSIGDGHHDALSAVQTYDSIKVNNIGDTAQEKNPSDDKLENIVDYSKLSMLILENDNNDCPPSDY